MCFSSLSLTKWHPGPVLLCPGLALLYQGEANGRKRSARTCAVQTHFHPSHLWALLNVRLSERDVLLRPGPALPCPCLALPNFTGNRFVYDCDPNTFSSSPFLSAFGPHALLIVAKALLCWPGPCTVTPCAAPKECLAVPRSCFVSTRPSFAEP